MMSQGWISVPRNLRNSWIWDRPQNVVIWLSMVMMANWEDGNFIFCNREFPLKRGQFVCSIRKLAARLDCSKQKLSSFLKLLESKGEISCVNYGRKFTVITILHYDEYYHPSTPKEEEITDLMTQLTSLVGKIEAAAKKEEPISKLENSEFTQSLGQYFDSKTVAKSGQIKEYKEISSSTPSLREKNLQFFEEIRQSETFWRDASAGLQVDIEELKQKGEKGFGEFLTKGKFKESREEVEDHLFNWLRKAVTKEKSQKDAATKRKSGSATKRADKIQTSDISSRRPVDPSPPRVSGIPKRRFVSTDAD